METQKAIELLLQGRFKNPQDFLGVKNKKIIFFQPQKKRLFLNIQGQKKEAEKIHSEGFFSIDLEKTIAPFDYQIIEKSEKFYDPYAFSQVITKEEIKRFSEGVHYDLYNLLGAHKRVHEGIEGVYFALWAPNAKSVFLKGDFCLGLPMRYVKGGIFELFVPYAKEEDAYFYEVIGKDGVRRVKTDPFGHFFEYRPEFKAKIFDVNRYDFSDHKWMDKRSKDVGPLNIYEVHLGSWKKGNPFLSYHELAHELVRYVKKMGYTHVELLPITEHPLDESWGYQVTGFFAPTSRFGTPYDFQYFVDYFHLNGIGVFMDWVPGHFPLDEFGLANFDGTSLYEHSDPLKGHHPVWSTALFDFGKPQVTNFLISSALFFFNKMHIDGIRVDAVSSMLFLDHERKDGQWKKNREGTNENLKAFSFVRHLTEIVSVKHPCCLMMAEESTAQKKVTHSVESGGLGFDYKWNMGWMNDTIKYFSTPEEYKSKVHQHLDFTFIYLFDEKFILPFSHDEVVHLKKSLFGKVGESFRELRLLLLFQYCYPGKKLLFMGQEFGQKGEWDCKDEISWKLLEDKDHLGLQEYSRSLNFFYKEQSALWEYDHLEEGFQCLFSHVENSTMGFLRNSKNQKLFCVFNFSEKEVSIPVDESFFLNEIFSCEQYSPVDKIEASNSVCLNPLSAKVFEVTIAKDS